MLYEECKMVRKPCFVYSGRMLSAVSGLGPDPGYPFRHSTGFKNDVHCDSSSCICHLRCGSFVSGTQRISGTVCGGGGRGSEEKRARISLTGRKNADIMKNKQIQKSKEEKSRLFTLIQRPQCGESKEGYTVTEHGLGAAYRQWIPVSPFRLRRVYPLQCRTIDSRLFRSSVVFKVCTVRCR